LALPPRSSHLERSRKTSLPPRSLHDQHPPHPHRERSHCRLPISPPSLGVFAPWRFIVLLPVLRGKERLPGMRCLRQNVWTKRTLVFFTFVPWCLCESHLYFLRRKGYHTKARRHKELGHGASSKSCFALVRLRDKARLVTIGDCQ